MADKMSKLILPVKTGNTIAPKEFDVGGGGNTFVGTTAEWNALTAEQQNVYDCRVLTDDDLATKSVIDNLTSDSATDALSAKQGKVLAQLVAPVLSTLVAPTGGLASGDQFVYNGLLYKATAAIAAGGTITIDGNCELADSVIKQIEYIRSLPIYYGIGLSTVDNITGFSIPYDGLYTLTVRMPARLEANTVVRRNGVDYIQTTIKQPNNIDLFTPVITLLLKANDFLFVDQNVYESNLFYLKSTL